MSKTPIEILLEEKRKIVLNSDDYNAEERARAALERAGITVKSDIKILAESLAGGDTNTGRDMVLDLFSHIIADYTSPGINAPDNAFTGGGDLPYTTPEESVAQVLQQAANNASAASQEPEEPLPEKEGTHLRRLGFLPRHPRRRMIKYCQEFQRRRVKPGQQYVTFFENHSFHHPSTVFFFHIAVYPTVSKQAAMRFLESMKMHIIVEKDIAYTLTVPAVRYTQRNHRFSVGQVNFGNGVGLKLCLEPFGELEEENPRFDIDEEIKVTACIEYMEDKPCN